MVFMKRYFASTALLIFVASCAPPSGPQAPTVKSVLDRAKLERVAEIRALDAQNASMLSEEGGLLYSFDRTKLSGPKYCGLAIEYARVGEFRQAIRSASKALFLGRRDGDAYVEGLGHRDLAYAYSLAGDLETAEFHAKRTLTLANRLNQRRERQLSFLATTTLASIAAKRADNTAAQRLFETAYQMAQRLPSEFRKRASGRVAIALANVALQQGNLVQAKSLINNENIDGLERYEPIANRVRAQIAVAEADYPAALKFYAASASGDGEDLVYNRVLAKAGEAAALSRSGDQSSALRIYLSAIDEAEEMRAKFRSEEFSSGAFADVQHVFDDTVRLAMQLGRPELALEVSERSRSRAALDLIRGRVTGQALAPTSSGTKLAPFAVSEAAGASTTAAAFQQLLPDDTAVVVYHLTPDEAFAWVVRQTGITATELQQTPEALDQASVAMRVLASSGGDLHQSDFVEFHNAVVGDLKIAEGEAIIFVPHRALHYTPFQSLWDGNQYLIEKNAVSYAPSMSILAELLEIDEGQSKLGLLAYGNPYSGRDLAALPGAEAEAIDIASRVPGAILRTGEAASEAAFKAEAPDVGLIHLAAHAKVDEIDPLYSTVFLAPASGQDGLLEAHEVYSLDLNGTDLITLSACETGLGRVGTGDEQWGFVRTFLSAGAKGAMVSNWDVSDEVTKGLMTAFYSARLEGETDAQALRTAQLSVLQSIETSAPLYWGAFSLWGNP